MSVTRHFADEFSKIALSFDGQNMPKVNLSKASITTRTGAGVPAPVITPPVPAIKSTVPSFGATSSVPTASGKNLGTKITPRVKTTPSAERGGSLVR